MPSQIKVDEIKNVAGQYKIKTNVFEGQTTAGSITVQGEGTATTNLQKGLTKVYVHVDQRNTQTIQGSFNVGTITDNATGVTITNYTNNMNDALYSVVGSNDGAVKAYYQHQFYSETTSSVYTYNSPDYSLNNADGVVCTAILGDLA